MKTLVTGFCLFGIVLSLCFGCTNSSSGKGDLIVVDTKANFPEKEICIQDLADVSYIPLYISDSTLVLRIFRLLLTVLRQKVRRNAFFFLLLMVRLCREWSVVTVKVRRNIQESVIIL
mgnify:CR=1 FL=1